MIVCPHAISLFDAVFMISAEIVIKVIAYLSQQLLIVDHGMILCDQSQ
jgi:hypothetical protein